MIRWSDGVLEVVVLPGVSVREIANVADKGGALNESFYAVGFSSVGVIRARHDWRILLFNEGIDTGSLSIWWKDEIDKRVKLGICLNMSIYKKVRLTKDVRDDDRVKLIPIMPYTKSAGL